MKNAINPDSTVLQQVDGQWQKLCALILWKTSGREQVRVTVEDIQKLQDDFAPGQGVIFTHGLSDGFVFQLIDEKRAHEIAAFDRAQRGNA